MNGAAAPRKLDELFQESGGRPVERDGEMIHMAYRIPVGVETSKIRLEFSGFVDEPVQGVCLQVGEGVLSVEGRSHPGLVFWMDAAPSVVDMGVNAEKGSTLQVWNCWRGKFGERAAWLGNAGMICDVVREGEYKFSCSSGTGRLSLGPCNSLCVWARWLAVGEK
ncbi:hypothetical protein SAV14893_020320 [Streptomyces avermitilis]|uniref:Uncharacterized protein n=1 Tax=Streptomyces avermitilis TaxID=33903 RepID=A0A4D4LXK4_STRAX|nr:hypothetical protein [Streptomyces avermitilis]GDY62639.1 hypothetical protein SAV14893_020320 [Streptomyces avermitilis]